MPNIVRNKMEILYASVETKNQVLDYIKSNESDFDFNKVVPMPSELLLDGMMSDAELDRKRAANKKKYGYESWYEFRWDKWGCKWPADEVFVNRKYFLAFFETPWETPRPLMMALSKAFPGITFKVTFADEDFTANCGVITYLDGEMKGTYYPKYMTLEAWKIVFDLWEECENDYELVDGTYVLKDDE